MSAIVYRTWMYVRGRAPDGTRKLECQIKIVVGLTVASIVLSLIQLVALAFG